MGAYDRIMERTGLRFYRVEGDVGMMGGTGAHEYMAPCPAGEDEVVLGAGFAANPEVAERTAGRRGVTARATCGRRATDRRAGDRGGNIFKLGTRYSEALGASYLDESGAEQPIWMASYGIGPARIVAAAVEQYADEHGISWPSALAPFAVHLVSIGSPGTPERDACERVYETLAPVVRGPLRRPRRRPGDKFADAELLGCPLRLTVGRRSLDSGEIEVQLRRGRAEEARRWRSTAPTELIGRWTSCGRAPLASGGCSDWTAPDRRPPETLAGQPLRVWTLPNAIGFVRLALIPVFLVVALSSSDGTSALAAALSAVIGLGDYLDGITARLTGQYSRLGTLLDPITDRVLIVAGVVVCWHFQLLPRWALALLAARELAMVLFARYGQPHGVELRINWPGRIAVAPVMGSLFFAMTGLAGWGRCCCTWPRAGPVGVRPVRPLRPRPRSAATAPIVSSSA